MCIRDSAHHVFGLRIRGEGGETSEITEENRDLTPVWLEQLRAPGHDHVGDRRREITAQAIQTFELPELTLDTFLQGPVPLGKLSGLLLDRVVVLLDPQQ